MGSDPVGATMLGLLTFVLAISIGGTATRYEQRRSVTFGEANAIGTAWLRTETIDDFRGARIRKIIERYTRSRASLGANAHVGMIIVDILDEGAARHEAIRTSAAPYQGTIQGFRRSLGE